jgi:YHS domain-containing protein
MATAKKASWKVVDPVCGMEVNPAKAPQTREVMDQIYYFCSNYCAEIFDPKISEPDLARLRAAIGGTGYRTRRTSAVWSKGIARGAVERLMDLLFRRQP